MICTQLYTYAKYPKGYELASLFNLMNIMEGSGNKKPATPITANTHTSAVIKE